MDEGWDAAKNLDQDRDSGVQGESILNLYTQFTNSAFHLSTVCTYTSLDILSCIVVSLLLI